MKKINFLPLILLTLSISSFAKKEEKEAPMYGGKLHSFYTHISLNCSEAGNTIYKDSKKKHYLEGMLGDEELEVRLNAGRRNILKVEDNGRVFAMLTDGNLKEIGVLKVTPNSVDCEDQGGFSQDHIYKTRILLKDDIEIEMVLSEAEVICSNGVYIGEFKGKKYHTVESSAVIKDYSSQTESYFSNASTSFLTDKCITPKTFWRGVQGSLLYFLPVVQ